MLVLNGDKSADHVVTDLPSLLRTGDCLVFNDTRVIPAQLTGKRGDATIGATLHKREGSGQVERGSQDLQFASVLHGGTIYSSNGVK